VQQANSDQAVDLPILRSRIFLRSFIALVRPQPILVDTLPLTTPYLPTAAPYPDSNRTGNFWPLLLLPTGLIILYTILHVGQRRYRLPDIPPQPTPTMTVGLDQGGPSHGR
ncbi:MAG: hypothetical protein ACMG6H_14395, partial [Acidobacteriota bacterium]